MGGVKNIPVFSAIAGAVIGFFLGGPAGSVVGLFGGLAVGGSILLGYDSLMPEIDYPSSPTYNGDLNNTVEENIVVPLAYGKVKVAGNIVRVSDEDDSGGLQMIVIHCQGEIERFISFTINDEDASGLWKGTVNHSNYLGTRTQIPDTRFTSNSEAYRSLAYSAWSIDSEDITGAPVIKTIIEASLCRQPNDTYKFSRNPAEILYDFYLRVEGKTHDDLDVIAFTTLENYCNQIPSGGTIARYRFDFIFDTATSSVDAKKLICSSFRGGVIVSGGKIKPVYESIKASSIFSFTESNIVENSISWWTPTRYNVIRVSFLNSENDYEQETVEVKFEEDVRERGEIAFEETCYFITDKEIAARRAQFLADKIQYTEYNCKFTSKTQACIVEPLDRVDITHALPGWIGKDFIVTSISEDPFGQLVFVCESYHPSIYGDNSAASGTGLPTNLPNPFAVPSHVTDLTVTEETYMNRDGKYVPRLLVTYSLPNNRLYWDHAEIYVRHIDEISYRYVGIDSSRGTGYYIDVSSAGLIIGKTAYIKVLSVNKNGIRASSSTAPVGSLLLTASVLNPRAPTGIFLLGASPEERFVWRGTRFVIQWRLGSVTGGGGGEPFGQEASGFGGVGDDEYWLFDEVQLLTEGVLRHKFTTKDCQYVYIYGDSIDSFLDEFLISANGTIQIKVRRWTKANKFSDWTSITLTHASPEIGDITSDFLTKDLRLGLSASTDPSFGHYSVLIYDDEIKTTLLRERKLKTNEFVYTLEMNAEDYISPSRTVYTEIKAVNVFNQETSEDNAFTNPPPAAPTGINIIAYFSKLVIEWDYLTDPDVLQYNIYVDTSPNPTTITGHSKTNSFPIDGAPKTTYYVRIKAEDYFGEGDYSAEDSDQTLSLELTAYEMDVPILQDVEFSYNAEEDRLEWTAGTLSYKGIVYEISSSATALRYIYWTQDNLPEYFRKSDTRPALGNNTYVIALFDSVTKEYFVAKSYKILHAGLLQVSTITADLIGTNQIITAAANIANAVIENAHISDVSASKITAGTIDASIINVINLDAADITTGILTGRTVRTASGNQRVEMSAANNNLILYKDESYISTGISFVHDGSDDYILDTNHGFGLYRYSGGALIKGACAGPGMTVIVSNSSSNNGTYTILSANNSRIYINETFTNESAGASITIRTIGEAAKLDDQIWSAYDPAGLSIKEGKISVGAGGVYSTPVDALVNVIRTENYINSPFGCAIFGYVDHTVEDTNSSSNSLTAISAKALLKVATGKADSVEHYGIKAITGVVTGTGYEGTVNGDFYGAYISFEQQANVQIEGNVYGIKSFVSVSEDWFSDGNIYGIYSEIENTYPDPELTYSGYFKGGRFKADVEDFLISLRGSAPGDVFIVTNNSLGAVLRARGDGVVNIGIGMTTAALVLPSLTTTQRDALSSEDGMIIYNVTLDKFQGYGIGGWRDLG